MLDLGEDLFFRHDVLLLMFLDNVFFFEHFESEDFVVLLAGNKTDLRIRSLTDYANEVEVVDRPITHIE